MKLMLTRTAFLLAGMVAPGGEWSYSQSTTKAVNTPVLLELFTSEGCSSCPAADRLIQSLDEEQPFNQTDLVVLSEHVDYWNHDGWVDPYSSHSFSERQLWYAKQFGLDDVFTPQAIVDGERQVVGSDSAGIRNAVETAVRNDKAYLVLSNAVRDSNRVKVQVRVEQLRGIGSATLYVALAESRVQTDVRGGENRGRSLAHIAVVRVLLPVETVKPGESFSRMITIPMPQRLFGNGIRVIAFLQAEKSHRIIGAARILLPS